MIFWNLQKPIQCSRECFSFSVELFKGASLLAKQNCSHRQHHRSIRGACLLCAWLPRNRHMVLSKTQNLDRSASWSNIHGNTEARLFTQWRATGEESADGTVYPLFKATGGLTQHFTVMSISGEGRLWDACKADCRKSQPSFLTNQECVLMGKETMRSFFVGSLLWIQGTCLHLFILF